MMDEPIVFTSSSAGARFCAFVIIELERPTEDLEEGKFPSPRELKERFEGSLENLFSKSLIWSGLQ